MRFSAYPLSSFIFYFLETLFDNVFQHSSILYTILQNKKTVFSYGVGKIVTFLDFLLDTKLVKAYDDVFTSVAELLVEPARSYKKHKYKQLFFQVIDNIAGVLEDCFADCRDFSFLDLVNPRLFPKSKSNVP